MLTVIVALDENTTLDIMIDKHLTNVSIPKGSVIVFDSAIGHCGSANPSISSNTRVHCKLKSKDIILTKNTVVEYNHCKYKCSQYFSYKKIQNEHHCNCRLCPNYDRRRKIVSKSDEKYRRRKKMEKLLKLINSKENGNESAVDDNNSNVRATSEKNALNRLFKDIDSHALTPSGDFET